MHLRLLGAFALVNDAGGAISLPTKKARALLAYLACQPEQPLTRSKLSSILWEDSAPAQAKEVLRQTLSALRKALSPGHAETLCATSDTVTFVPRGFQVDVLEFQRLTESASPADWNSAAQLYRGPFLDGFDIPAPEFDVWLRSVRQHCQEHVIQTLRKLLHHYLAEDNVDRCLTIGSRLLSLDPMREGVHRSMMELYLRQGRYIDALRQYERCAAILRKELDIEPDAQTRRLHQKILERRRRRQDDEQPSWQEPPRPAPFPSQTLLPPALPLGPHRLERRQVTILFCQFCGPEGLHDLATSLDLDDLRSAVSARHRRFTDVVSRFGGVLVHLWGEAMTFHFGYPQALEHGPEQAIRAGLALIEEAQRVQSGIFMGSSICIAIATSPVVVGDFAPEGEDPAPGLIGEAPGRAARLLSRAGPGDIVICEQTHREAGGLFKYEALSRESREAQSAESGPLRGRVSDGWRVLGENAARGRFEAFRGACMPPFVGREAELERLCRRWELARRGEGQIKLIIGEPGIGKSRLARAFQNVIESRSIFRLMYQCSPFHTNSSLHPVIRHMEHAARFDAKDSGEQKLDKLEALLGRRSAGGAESVPLCAALLSIAGDRYPPLALPPHQLRRKIFDTLLNRVEDLANQRPLLVLIEDAHWLDATSVELLDLFSERIRRLRALAVMTCRPGFEPAWSGLDHVGRLCLGGLDQREARAMVNQIGGGIRLPLKIVEQIVGKADGVPLFVEQLAKSVIESGASPQEADADPPLVGPRPLAVPETLRESLLARLDHLASAKEVAQVGAVIGREFSFDLLQALTQRWPQDLHDALTRLAASGLVRKTSSSPRESYAFRHALVQEAAYDSLPKSERRRLHASIARALDEKFPGEAHGQPEIKARHYTAANMPAEALRFWLKAGELAKARSANREAIAHLQEGLDLIEGAPILDARRRRSWERSLLLAIGPAVMAMEGYTTSKSESIFERARLLIDDATPAGERIHILRGLWSVQFARSNLQRALELAEEVLSLARSTNEGLCRAHCMVGQVLTSMGEFKRARDHLQFVIDSFLEGKISPADPHFTPADYPWALVYMARVLWGLGLMERSAKTAEEAVARARAGSDSVATAVAFLGRMFLAVHGAELQESMASAEEALVHCTEQELSLFGLWILFGRGALLARQGKFAAAIDVMRSAVDAADTLRSGQFRPFQLGCIAEACFRLGDLPQALASVDEALDQAERSGERQSAVSLHRLRGEILAALGRAGEASQEFAEALYVARRQGARLEELRVTIVLARLAQGPAETEKALKSLRAICETFEEGQDHPYLKAARDVLAACHASA